MSDDDWRRRRADELYDGSPIPRTSYDIRDTPLPAPRMAAVTAQQTTSTAAAGPTFVHLGPARSPSSVRLPRMLAVTARWWAGRAVTGLLVVVLAGLIGWLARGWSTASTGNTAMASRAVTPSPVQRPIPRANSTKDLIIRPTDESTFALITALPEPPRAEAPTTVLDDTGSSAAALLARADPPPPPSAVARRADTGALLARADAPPPPSAEPHEAVLPAVIDPAHRDRSLAVVKRAQHHAVVATVTRAKLAATTVSRKPRDIDRRSSDRPLPKDNVAPSFNCRRAHANVNRMICGDPELAALDRELAVRYRAVDRRTSHNEFVSLHDEETEFLNRRQNCRTPACVASLYRARIDELGPGR